jgi:pimeloyl-ACP methyl ester carboxylesterase
MTPEVAASVAEGFNADMGRCILALYRSAAQPAMAEWGKELPAAAARPGLVLSPSDDPFTGGPDMARRSAERAGAQFVVLEGVGHWWMTQDPAAGAKALTEFWVGVESSR